MYGLASFMALAESVQLAAEVQLGSSDVSGLPPPDAHKTVTKTMIKLKLIIYSEKQFIIT